MTKEILENYAHTLLVNYAPRSKEEANYDLRNKVSDRKQHELESLIMRFPSDIDVKIKAEVAKMSSRKLMEEYVSFNMR